MLSKIDNISLLFILTLIFVSKYSDIIHKQPTIIFNILSKISLFLFQKNITSGRYILDAMPLIGTQLSRFNLNQDREQQIFGISDKFNNKSPQIYLFVFKRWQPSCKQSLLAEILKCFKCFLEISELFQLFNNYCSKEISEFCYKMMNWTPEEQNMLKTLKESQENLSWAAISKSLIKMFQDKYHTPKQCRERYINYVRFQRNDQKFLKWSKEEEDLLYNLYQKIGSNWNKIGESFDYKSENTIKNKFYGNLRKLLRRLNAIGKSTRKLRKELRYQSLIRPLQISQSQIKDSQLIEIAIGLRGRLISFLRNNFDNLTQDIALNFIEHVNKFNLQSRSMSRKRYKKECEIDDDQKKDQRKSSENKEDRNVQNGDCKIEEVIQELHVKVQEQKGVEKMAQPTSKEYQIKRENNIIVSGNWNINSNHTYPIMNSPLPFNFTIGCFPYSNHILNMMTMQQFSENIAQMYPKSYNNNITNSTRSTSLEIQNPIGSSFRRIQPQ